MERLNQVLAKKQFKTLSPLEMQMVEELLKYDGLRFESNFPVGKYQIDIAFPKHKVGLEIDGLQFHTSPKQIARDEIRQGILENRYGWKIERIAGWFCKRYVEIAAAKVLRHIPEMQEHPRYKDSCIKAKQWLARELMNTGQKAQALRILSDLSK